jgi:hypothetical protein
MGIMMISDLIDQGDIRSRGYLVLAHYIRVHLKWSQQKKLAVGAICFVIGGLFTAWSFWWKAEPGLQMETPMMEWSWEFCTPNVLLATFGSFLLFIFFLQ